MRNNCNKIRLESRLKLKEIRAMSSGITKYVRLLLTLDELIGKGGFAKVYRATEVHTKTEVAVKIINLHEISIKDIEHLKREIFIHTKLQHPNIVKIYE